MTAFRINLPFASRMVNDVFWPEVRVGNSVKLCLYSCRERQVTGQTRNYMKSLYKIPLYFRNRPNPDVENVSLDGKNVL